LAGVTGAALFLRHRVTASPATDTEKCAATGIDRGVRPWSSGFGCADDADDADAFENLAAAKKNSL
jgi:hypothetical protein